MKEESDSEVYRCSFCNKSQTEVRKLIAGPNTFKLPYSEKWILLQLLIDELMQAHLKDPI